MSSSEEKPTFLRCTRFKRSGGATYWDKVNHEYVDISVVKESAPPGYTFKNGIYVHESFS